MPSTYYQIELSGRLLTILLLLLAVLLVLAFAFGYGAAWSVIGGEVPRSPAVTAAVMAARAAPPEAPPPLQPSPTATAPSLPPVETTPTVVAPATPTAEPTPEPVQPTATAVAAAPGELWVQVLAVNRRKAVDEARKKLATLDFPIDHQRLIESEVAGGGTLFKLRVGPFPDQSSAERTAKRLKGLGFPDAWVVVP